jgi:general secretion pathway protein N
MRVLAAILAVVVALLWQAPATLIDAGLDRVSGGSLRLAQAGGTIWSGQGVVMGLASAPDAWGTWLPAEWTFDVLSVSTGVPAWEISSGGLPVARLGLGLRGIVVSRLKLRGPARYFLERIPHNIGHAGWKGDIAVETPRFQCSWHGHCEGHLEVHWTDATSDFLPGQRLGNYHLTMDGTPSGELNFQLRTLDGTIRVDGSGRWTVDSVFAFDGTIKGSPELLQRLPSIAGPWIQPSGEAGTWAVAIRWANKDLQPSMPQ